MNLGRPRRRAHTFDDRNQFQEISEENPYIRDINKKLIVLHQIIPFGFLRGTKCIILKLV